MRKCNLRALLVCLTAVALLGAVSHVANDGAAGSASTVTSLSVSVPHTPAPGDELLAVLSLALNGDSVTSSGWTCSAWPLSDKLYYCYETAPSSSATSWTFSFGSTNGACAAVAEFSGVKTSRPVSLSIPALATAATVTESILRPQLYGSALPIMFVGNSNGSTGAVTPSGWSWSPVYSNLATGSTYCHPAQMIFDNSEVAATQSENETVGYTSYTNGTWTQAAALLLTDASAQSLVQHVGTDKIGETTTASTSLSLTANQAPSIGDLVLAHIISNSPNDTLSASGYDCSTYRIASTTGGGTYFACWHIAGANESAALPTFTSSSAMKFCYDITEWSGVNPSTPFAGGPTQTYGSNVTSTTLAYPAPSPALAQVSAWTFSSGGALSNPGTVFQQDQSFTGGSQCPSQYSLESKQPYQTSGGSDTLTYSSNYYLSAFEMELNVQLPYFNAVTSYTPNVYYPMNDASGTSMVDAMAHQNGTIGSGLTLGYADLTTDPSGSSYYFPGGAYSANNNATTPQNATYMQPTTFTMNFWARFATFPSVIVNPLDYGGNTSGTNYAWLVQFDGTTGNLNLWLNNGGAECVLTSAITSSSVPYMITLSYDGSNIRGYVNGSKKNTCAYATALSYPGTAGLNIGELISSKTSTFNGPVSDVALFSGALSDTQIANLYNEAKTAQPSVSSSCPATLLTMYLGCP